MPPCQQPPVVSMRCSRVDSGDFHYYIKTKHIKIDIIKIIQIILELSTDKLKFNELKIFLNTGITEEQLNNSILEINPEIIKNYSVLGLSPGSQTNEIKKTYRKLAIQFHPDKLSNLEQHQKKQAREVFLKIKTAYEEIIKERSL